MCWNQDISINTFLFACLALLYIALTNTFTKYKTPTFDNPVVYLFLLEVASMQLIEFFLWRNLKNKSMNEFLSKIASVFVTIQPLTLIFMIPQLTLKYGFLFSYAVFLIVYFEYKRIYNPIHFNTSIGKNGHLSWNWMNFNGFENILPFVFLLYYIIPLIIIDNTLLSIFVIVSLIISLYFYFIYNTFGTIWCWSINLFLLYFIVDILVIQTYYEYNGLC